MATESRIGTRIKRARERRRWSQQHLADVIGVNRKTIDNWENGRTYPRSSLGALESALGPLNSEGEIYTDPAEVAVWEDESLGTDSERRAIIHELRARRREHARRAHRSSA